MPNSVLKKVAVIEPGYPDYKVEQEILKDYVAQWSVIPIGTRIEDIISRVHDADALLVREAQVPAALINSLERCQVIVRYGIGVDNIDLNAARKKGIYVANVARYGADEVSNQAVALLLAASRWVAKRDRDVRRGVWGVGSKEKIFSFKEMSLGIVGFGSIAQAFARKMQPFGFRKLLVCDPFVDAQVLEEFGATRVHLDDLCREAEVISLHAPLAAETRHMIGKSELALMSPRTILINTGRGPLIDESALAAALKERRIKAAGIDVFEAEPPAKDHPFFKLDNVVMSDHAGWYSESSIVELQSKAASEIERVFKGEKPRSWVNSWEN